jgi:hypothetical protein
MTRRSFFLVALLALATALPARADVPVRVRLMKATKAGAAYVDPKLEPLKRQLAEVNYARWEQVAEKELTLAKGKTEYVSLPNGDPVAITVQDVKPTTVTFEVAIPSHNAVSQAKIERGQRILQQVTRPADGMAFFVSVSWQ